MDLGQFILMRQELLLTLAAVAVLIAEVSTSEKNKARIIPFALGLFALITIIGFIPRRKAGFVNQRTWTKSVNISS